MKRGFFLSLTAFVILMFITSTLSMRFSALEESRSTYIELAKQTSYRVSFAAVNKAALNKMFEDVLRHAIYKVAEHSINHTIVPAGDDGLLNVRRAIYDTAAYGEASSGYFEDAQELNATGERASMVELLRRINTSLREKHMYIESFVIPLYEHGGDIELADYKTVYGRMPLNITIRDEEGLGLFNLSFTLEANVSITGIPDPLVNRYLLLVDKDPIRGFYFTKDAHFPSLSGPIKTLKKSSGSIYRGQGWTSGYILKDVDITTNYILYGNFTAVRGISAKGYLVNDKPGKSTSCTNDNGKDYEKDTNTFNGIKYVKDEDGDCQATPNNFINTTFFVNLNKSIDKIISVGANNYYLLVTDNKPMETSKLDEADLELLTDHMNEIKKLEIYDITPQREAMWSQGYFKWDKNYTQVYSDPPPNFFQRMLTNGQDYKDEDKGIFSFLESNEFNTPRDVNQVFSRVDFELARGIFSGDNYGHLVVIRGFEGCKDPDMCKLDPTDSKVNRNGYTTGRLVMTEDFAEIIGLGNLTCSWDDADEGCYP